MKRICVFCGSRSGVRPEYVEAARAMGRALLRRNIGLVYGGGCVGLMGVIADVVVEGNGEVIGVIPQFLAERELAHSGITELVTVHSMHERKAIMAQKADAFVALPGGYGTIEEFCETLTWAQLELHRKPCGILNFANYYDPLIALLDHAVVEGFLTPKNRSLVIEETDPERLVDLLANYTPPPIKQLVGLDES
jgi:uncharacterized protein (TIGR00730 family)